MIVHKMVLLATAFKQRTAVRAPTKVGHRSTTRCLYEHYKVLCTDTTRCLYGHYKALVRTLQDACTDATRCLYGRYKALCTVTATSLYTRIASKMLVDKLLKPNPFNDKIPSMPQWLTGYAQMWGVV